jgi:photosynthetic reaction center cytochrome c subunit
MKSADIISSVAYAAIGLVLGGFLGFQVANWTSARSAGGSQAAGESGPKSASVNTSSRPDQLPPNHPALDSAPTEAPPLRDSPGSEASGGAAAGEVAELPSLDPLPASSKEERTEQKYKNIQMLKGLPSERLTKVMFAFKSSLGVECTFCHVKDQFEKDDKSTKQTARTMIKMVRDINKQYVGGLGRVTCYTCHRGQQRPAS